MDLLDIHEVSVQTKTYVTAILPLLALFEFVTAMHVFGKKGSKWNAKFVLTLHRVVGYVFLVCLLWPILDGADLLGRLSQYADNWHFDGNRFFHAYLGITVLIMLLLKIVFVRFYNNFRNHAHLLGILITIGTITTWLIAGWFWLCMMGGRTAP